MDSESHLQVRLLQGLSPVLVASAIAVLYVLGLALYRLYFHPLAKFPGPKLAAATSWYEAYYEIVCNGQYFRKISELHEIYGTSASDIACATTSTRALALAMKLISQRTHYQGNA